MNVFSVFHHLQKDKQRKQRHLLKLSKERRESSKRNYYIISPRVIIKAIINITSVLEGVQQPNKSPKPPGNAFSDAVQYFTFSKFHSSGRKEKEPRSARFFEATLRAVLINKLIDDFIYQLRWGWVFLERTRILSGIQLTRYFIELLLWERNDSSVVI